MKKRLVLFLTIISFTQNTFAHQDFWMIKDYGNVKVRIKTGFDYEEIKKAFIYGQLVEKLASELSYKEQIFLDFNHHYIGKCESGYFISYDKGAIAYTWSGATTQKPIFEKNAIVIRQVSNTFDAKTTLKLAAYAIQNLSEVKTNQNYIDYNKNYCQWRIKTIDSSKIKDIVNGNMSKANYSVMPSKIERPDKEFKFGHTYYWQNDKYIVIERDTKGKETPVKEFDNIHEFRRVGNCIFIFTSVSDFFTLNKTHRRRPKVISKKWSIENAELNYRPYKIEHLGGYKYSIYFIYRSNEKGWQPKEQTLIYDESSDEMIKL